MSRNVNKNQIPDMQSVSRFSAKQMADKLFLAGDIFIESHIRNKTFNNNNNNKSNKKKNLFSLRMKKNTHLKKEFEKNSVESICNLFCSVPSMFSTSLSFMSGCLLSYRYVILVPSLIS